MKKIGFDQLRTEVLVSYVAGYAKVCAIATDMGDSQISNLGIKKRFELHRLLRTRGREAQVLLREMLQDDDPSVRMAAAYPALEFAPEEAERVLEQIAATEQRFVGLNAQMLLQEWRKGTLKFPWEFELKKASPKR
ncbi:MAG: DUF2019 domain-containing protein [Betaproteobacteria bacterium]|nr:DUF2019 domain-containing protein [Betaproteobacteria bacterium]